MFILSGKHVDTSFQTELKKKKNPASSYHSHWYHLALSHGYHHCALGLLQSPTDCSSRLQSFVLSSKSDHVLLLLRIFHWVPVARVEAEEAAQWLTRCYMIRPHCGSDFRVFLSLISLIPLLKTGLCGGSDISGVLPLGLCSPQSKLSAVS